MTGPGSALISPPGTVEVLRRTEISSDCLIVSLCNNTTDLASVACFIPLHTFIRVD